VLAYPERRVAGAGRRTSAAAVVAGWVPLLTDLLITVVALGVSLTLLDHRGVGLVRSGSSHDPVGVALVLVATIPLLWWRRFPFPVFAVSAVASAVAAGIGQAPGIPLGPVVALYLLAAGRAQLRPWAGWPLVVLAAAFPVATIAAEGGAAAPDLLHGGLS